MEKAKIIGRVNWLRPEEECYKIPFDSKAEAREVAKLKRRGFKGIKNEPYRCETCSKWHLTSKGVK